MIHKVTYRKMTEQLEGIALESYDRESACDPVSA